MNTFITLLVVLSIFTAGIWMVIRRWKNRGHTKKREDIQPLEKKTADGPVKHCSECKAEISKKAKKCMYCGSKQSEVGFGGLLAGGMVVLAVIVFVSLQNNLGTLPETPKRDLTLEEKTALKDKSDASALCQATVRRAAMFPGQSH